MVRRSRLLWWAGGAFALAVLLGGDVLIQQTQASDDPAHPLVVIHQDGSVLREGNGLRYPARWDTPLNRGVEARLRYDRGAWLQIELAGGEIGWVARQDTVGD
jgi:hypothetical protein